MEMKKYLIDTFQFNDLMNRKLLEKIKLLPDKKESVRYFSHLINSQKKWMARIVQYPNDPKMDWWDPLYSFDELAAVSMRHRDSGNAHPFLRYLK